MFWSKVQLLAREKAVTAAFAMAWRDLRGAVLDAPLNALQKRTKNAIYDHARTEVARVSTPPSSGDATSGADGLQKQFNHDTVRVTKERDVKDLGVFETAAQRLARDRPMEELSLIDARAGPFDIGFASAELRSRQVEGSTLTVGQLLHSRPRFHGRRDTVTGKVLVAPSSLRSPPAAAASEKVSKIRIELQIDAAIDSMYENNHRITDEGEERDESDDGSDTGSEGHGDGDGGYATAADEFDDDPDDLSDDDEGYETPEEIPENVRERAAALARKSSSYTPTMAGTGSGNSPMENANTNKIRDQIQKLQQRKEQKPSTDLGVSVSQEQDGPLRKQEGSTIRRQIQKLQQKKEQEPSPSILDMQEDPKHDHVHNPEQEQGGLGKISHRVNTVPPALARARNEIAAKLRRDRAQRALMAQEAADAGSGEAEDDEVGVSFGVSLPHAAPTEMRKVSGSITQVLEQEGIRENSSTISTGKAVPPTLIRARKEMSAKQKRDQALKVLLAQEAAEAGSDGDGDEVGVAIGIAPRVYK